MRLLGRCPIKYAQVWFAWKSVTCLNFLPSGWKAKEWFRVLWYHSNHLQSHRIYPIYPFLFWKHTTWCVHQIFVRFAFSSQLNCLTNNCVCVCVCILTKLFSTELNLLVQLEPIFRVEEFKGSTVFTWIWVYYSLLVPWFQDENSEHFDKVECYVLPEGRWREDTSLGWK